MKKIMIALASIAFAMASQAATVNWQGAYATDNAGTGLATGATTVEKPMFELVNEVPDFLVGEKVEIIE